MSEFNTFQILAKKKILGIVSSLFMKDDEFAKDLIRLLQQYKEGDKELIETLKDFREFNQHNIIEGKTKDYVENRFNLFDENLNGINKI